MKQKILALIFYILPHHAITWIMFKASNIQWKPLKNAIIQLYTKLNPVNMQEAIEEDKLAYPTLNAFFTRALKPESRPLDKNKENWVCPVDGVVSQAQAIENGRIFQAKGQSYTLLELLGGDEKLANKLNDGLFATLYLSPRDYHRIHMPSTAKLVSMRYIPGRLFSVASFVVNHIPRLFARNERCVCYFESEQGSMVLVLVGAINVSAMETVWHGLINSMAKKIKYFDYENKEIELKRGQEMGRFNLGSTVIVLCTDKMTLNEKIKEKAEIKLGQCLATPNKK